MTRGSVTLGATRIGVRVGTSRSVAILGALAGVALLALPPSRHWLEASMTHHMLIQIPALVALGWLGARSPSNAWREHLEEFNAHGLVGLLFALVVTSYWMLPVTLDRAVAEPGFDAVKFASLVLCGAALQVSWRSAGVIIQAFFLGNWVWMAVFAGLLYRETPEQLCSAYLLDDQFDAGTGMIAGGVALTAAWAAVRCVAALRRNDRDQ